MECKDGLHNCSQVCIELQGQFSCACYDGYELLEDGASCKGNVVNYIHPICNYNCICTYLININNPLQMAMCSGVKNIATLTC